MRTIIGDAPNSIENQSVIDVMYRAWFFIFSIGILLPLRWLPHLLPKPSKITFPAVATAVLITCGELMLANPTVTPAGPYCPGATVQISFTGTNLPEGDNIEVFIDDISTYNPFLGGGTPIGTIPIDYSCTTCPSVLALMINPCSSVGLDDESEFMMLHSGCGFNVSDIIININGGILTNDSIGGSNACQFEADNSALVAQILSNSTGCAGHIISAGPGDVIPPAAIVLVFTDNSATPIDFDFSALCATGQDIYILRNTCNRGNGAFTNSGTHTYGYTLAGCPGDNISYTNPPPGSSITNVTIMENGSAVTSSSCEDPGLSSVAYPDIPITTATLSYTLPTGICGSGTGLVNFYVSGMIDLIAPCADMVYTPPSALSLAVACPVDIVAAGPFCSNGAPVQLTVTGSMGPGTWSGGPYISSTGIFDPSLASIGNNTVTYTEAPCGSVNEVIVVNSPPVINEDFIPSATTCANDPSGQIVNSSFITGGTAPYTYDWDYADVPGNEVYPDDGNTFFPHGLNGVLSGFYDFIVTDALGCSDVATVFVPEGDPVTATFQIDPILCFGGMTGGIQITSSNGPPVSGIIYNWDNLGIPGDQNFGGPPAVDDDSQNISGLGAGSYAVTITYEDPGFFTCTFDTTFVITEPTQLTLAAPDVALPCFGNTGTLTATPSGGTPLYIYNWSHIGGSNNPPPWPAVIAGNYIITVTDANGCSIVDVVAVTQPTAALVATATGEVLPCNNGTGDINLTVTPGTGTPPYTFVWSNGPTTEDQSGLNAGTYTVTVTDLNGCTTTAQAVISVVDIIPPVITCPANLPLGCNAPVPAPNPGSVTATDACGAPLVTNGGDVTSTVGCIETTLRTYIATDVNGLTASCVQTITRTVDVTPPTISCPAPLSIPGCNAAVPAPDITSVTASDGCGGITVTHVSDVPSTVGCVETTTRTYMATDACGNTNTCTQLITRTVDVTPPVLSGLPGPTTIQCSATPMWTTPTVTDGCGVPVLSSMDVTTSGSCPDAFTITRTWTATDPCGNTATASQIINVTDTTVPVISPLPAPSTIECTAVPSFTTPTATDNCSSPILTFNAVTTSGACPDSYTITRTWTATDECGNTATAVQVINVVDSTPPVIGPLPGPTTIECSGTPTWTTPTVTDNCGMPVLTFANVTTSGSCPNEFSITRTWTATDDCGNTSTATQTINVDDTVPPVISPLPGPTNIECSATPSWTTPTATDNCSTPTLTFADVTTNGSCPNEFSITRTWTANDGCGNTSTASQTINVDDTTPPVISGLPAPTTIECSVTPSFTTPTATDNCGVPMLTFANVTVNGSCPNEFSITRTWTATDLCGNTATASQTINVDDTTPPVISGLPAPTTIECSAAPSFTTPTATDNCGLPTLTFADVTTNGSCPNEFSITRTWTATDLCGNVTVATQTINVDDTVPPVISALPGVTTIECSGAPSFTTPTATDNCGVPTLTFADVTTNGSCPNEFSITRTWTATDLCGNVTVATQTINVDDTVPPVISALPGVTTIECSGAPSFTTPTATDNCGVPTLTFADVTTNGTCPNEFSITRTWTATDLCGNVTVATQTINVDDTVPPVISGLPGPTTIECSTPPTWTTPTATDNCAVPTLTSADVTTNGPCPGSYSITRTWTANDGCGNTATASQTINVDDTTPPVISGLPGPSTIECSVAPSWATPTATDNCGTPTLTFADVTTNGSCPNEFSITRTWTADDGCGNTATASQTINVDDTTPPVISGLPGPTTIECSGTPTFATPTATDNCGAPMLSFADVTTNGSCPNEYSITRTWTATDLCGNTATATQTINVDDTMPPVLSALPGPTTIECSGIPSWTTPTATDNCGVPTLTFADVTMTLSCPSSYSITRTWTATDLCGNTATASQIINVDDTMPPVISALPGATTIECSGTPSWTTPTATDNCGVPVLTFADVTTNGTCPSEYSITRTWTATDACGNTATATQTINVDDTVPPVISGLPGPSAIECSGTPSWTTPTATDNCGTPTLTFADVTTNGSCPNEYTITRTWTADDGCGNTATASQVINVDDTTPPVISGLPGPSAMECSGVPSWTTPTATDNCGTPTLSFADVTTNGSCPNEYTITRTWTADDGCGNTATASQIINVDDTTPPVISGLPGPTTIECSAAPSWATPTATDNCGTPTLSFADVTTNGSCPNEYSITRTWTADDGCGNTATASQTINVDDTMPPVISGLPGPTTIECSGIPSWTTPTATDNCDVPVLTFADVTMTLSCAGSYSITRTWTATDDCGNTATASQTINVDDTMPPVISGLPGVTTIECSGTPAFTTPTATDNCGVPVLTFADVTTNGTCPNEYSITRTWTATDPCGNTATATQTINVDDTVPPVISGLPGPSTIECSGTPSWTTPTATDNCAVPTLSFADVTTNGACPGEYSITRTWTADDGCGNTATASQTINVEDTTPPVISGLPGPSAIECSGIPSWTTPTATDNCGVPTLSFADVTTNGSCPNEYTVTRTWTADDGCGNTATAAQVFNVDDTTPPVISGLPGPSTIECSGTPSWTTPTATDNCGVPTLSFADVTTNGTCPNEYSITRTWTADDGCGNTATATQTINVDDTTPPVISGLPGVTTIECSGTPSWTTPTATDNCGVPVLTFADVTTNGTCPNEYSITRTWTATDDCGNTATASQTINVDDTVPPVISGLPGPSTIECSGVPSWTTPTATDNCGTPTLTFADVTTNGSCPNEYTITRTWTADDGCGNTATASQVFNVDDTTPPVISGLPGVTTIECGGTPSFDVPTATDNCGVPTLTFADVTTNGSCPNEFSITRTWTADDGCGNTATASQTINVEDTTPPVISGLPGPSTIECSAPPAWTTPTATDNCGVPTLTFADVTTNGSCPNEYSITRTWTADDGCGNTATASQTINVDDTTPPVISGLPGPSTIECSGVPSWTTPTATDNCGVPTLSSVDVTVNGTCPNEYSITRTWTADDGCGNTATASQTINVDDTVPPVISGLPGPSTIECSGTPSWTTPTATDNCGVPTLTFADVTTNGTCPNEYSITRTWTADDGCGNTATASQTINVDDTTPPVISGLPGPSTIECSGTPSWTTPTATDNCGTPTLTFADVTTNGSCPNEYSITRTWTADDGCGNTATASQTINVDDTTPPVISGLPGVTTIECGGTPSFDVPTATDNCGVPTLTFADVTTNGSCPNEYSITRTWTADDGCGNTATASQTINVEDTTPPVISGLPGPSTIECSGTPSWTTPTATDNCAVPTLTFADVTTNGSCPNEYSITRTWTADDGCGNTATASQTINVDDTTPPVISGLPGPSTIECSGVPSWTTPTTTDNCGTPTLTFADVTVNGTCPNEYSVTRTWTADDGCGNTATASQTISVDDTTPPVISGLPGTTTIECSGTPSWTTPTATDNCGTPTLTFADVTTNGSCPNEYSITRTWTADDGCGNTAAASQTINVDDTVPPVISGLPAPSTIECSGTPSWTTPTATDNCGTPTLTFADVTTNGSCPNEYSITRTWTADDGCGNTATASQTINVDDTTPPVISGLPGVTTIECGGTPAFDVPTATDNCGVPTLNFADVTTNGSCPNEYSITRTWTADDGCGNTATASQTINVEDTTPPVISGLPGPSTIECSGIPSWTTPTATDNCAVPTLTFSDVTTNGSCPNEYSITRTWTADDGCGNTATASQTINVDDTTPPVISGLPGPSTVECSVTPSFTTPTATDNCSAPTLTFADVTVNGTCPNEYSVTRTWTADDGCGNTATASQTINVDDTVPPVISGLPAPTTIECSGTPSWTTPTATDNCGVPTLTFADVTTNGSCPNEYSITRTWTADDGCGNTATASQTINVDDTVPPVISGLPGPSSIECSATPSWTTPTATDNCGTPTLTFADVTTNGTCPNEYSITRTWTADDGCGNTATASQTINVDDTTPPVISALPGVTTIECGGTPSFVVPTATDNCAVPTLTFADVTTNGSCPNEYSITRTWTANDGCGNTATASQTINVEDTTPPVISGLPGVTTIECSGTPSFDVPTATDNCGVPTLTFADVTTNGSCPNEYSITRTWTADDACGNTATASQTINVEDTTPPVISGLPGPSTIECSGTPSWTTPTATDNCSAPVLTFADVTTNGSCPNEYSITRTWTATDACGNVATATQTINVDDTTPPTASNPAAVSVECIDDVPVVDVNVVNDEADNCPGLVTVAFVSETTTGGPCPEVITRTYSVTDACGNQTLVTHTITINDVTPPTASSPATVTVDCIADVPAPDVNVITDETDNCPASLVVAFVSDVSDGATCPETITRTYSVTDGCGNILLVTQTISVDDDVFPTASNPGPITVDCIGDVPAPDVNLITDEADNCPGAITVTFVGDVSDGGTCPETITRTYSVTDACGNQILVTQTITVDDNILPTASNPGPLTADCSGSIPLPDVNVVTDEADNCPAPITVAFVSDVSDGGSCPETVTRTYSVTDACGNQIFVTQTITVGDVTNPTASNPAPINVECIGDVPAPDVNVVTDEADNCAAALTVAFVNDVSSGGPCPEVITRTYSITDACGNQIFVTQTITVNDITPPTASNPAPVAVECIGDVPVADVNVITDESDNCIAPIVVAFVSDVPDGASCPLTITRTYSITDACGNQNLVTQTITVNDLIPPTASNPSPIIVSGCNTAVPAPDISYVTDAADNCSAPVVAFVSDVADLVGCTETTTRTFSVTDACNNSITVEQLITRTVDNTPPVFTNPPADITVDCIAQVPAMAPLDYTDNCSPGGTIVGVETGPTGNPLTITREWTVTDDCGNVATEIQTITITQVNGSGTETYTGCVGDGYSVVVNGTTYDESNPTGTETLPGAGGCDSTVTISLTFNPTSTGSETYNGCVGDGYSVIVGGTVYNEGNPNGTETLTNSFGCDSTVTIALNFELTTSGNEDYTGCTGDGYSVVVGTTTYNELNPSGTETLTGPNGCDSIVTVLLIFNLTSTGTETYTGCEGDGYSVVVNGNTYDESNPNGVEVLTGYQGCDSTVTITLVFAPAGFGAENYLGCEGDGYSIVVNGTTYDEFNPTGIETFPGPGGCDSTVNINLIFNPLTFGNEDYNGCQGDGYSVVVGGTTYNQGNPNGTEVLTSSTGCDSTVTIDLNYLPTSTGDETYSGCEGDGYSVVVNGTVYDELNPAGTEILTGINGCDSTVTILLTFAPAGNGTEIHNGCEGDGYSVVVNGTTYDELNPTGTEVFPGGGGCDSTVDINLVFNPITNGSETYNGCIGDGYSVTVNGTLYNEGNPTGTETLTGPNGCDSIVDIALTFNPVLEGEELYSGCEGDGYSVVVNGTLYNESNPIGIEIINGAGCDSIVTIDLQFAPFVPAAIAPAGPICTEAGVLTLTASPAGGIWSGAVTSDQFDPALLGPGTYEVIYTTPAGPCQSADTIDIVVYELVISCLTIQNETAPMANDGQGQITVSGGVPDYNVTWTGPATGSVVLMADGDFIISSLPPGTYTVEVTDATGCTTTCQFTIISAIPCDLSIDDIIVQDATCSGVDNGAATIILSGSMIPFQYSMDGGAPVNTNVFTMLAAGPHTIVVSDAAGCTAMQNFLVGAGPGPSLAEGVTVDASCGDCNGSIDVVVSGGAPPYNYSIDGIMYGLSSLFPGLCAGTYDIYLIDDGGCTDTITLTVIETNAPIIDDIIIGGSSCGQADGSITIIASGGLDPLMYSIDGGANFQISNFFDGHPAGTYSIVVRDAAGCQVTGTANIQDIGAPVIDGVITTPTSCGTFDGTITINASGGTPPLEYSIDGGANFQSSNFFEFLPAGNYDIVVRDDNGCQAIDMVTLNTTNGPVIDFVLLTHTSCGDEDGIIEIIATGGIDPLMYSIDGGINFQSSNIFDMLPEGDYDIVVVDESNCPVTDQVTINGSDAPRLDVYYTLAHCGRPDGQLEVEGDLGVPPYMYSINGGNFSVVNVFVGLISDFYTLAVKDANDCIFEIDVLLEDDDLPEITNVITVDPLCGMTNGSIEIEATGDGLQYSILTPAVYQASPIFDPVTPGTYTINVRDQYGCFAVPSSAVINPMPNPAFTTVIVDSECGMNSGSIDINASSGTMPYLYSIGGPFVATDIFTGLAAGTYTVTVRDINNCEVSGDVVIISVGTQTGALDTSICDGEVIIIDGNVFNTAGTYTIPISGGASNGCDSTLTLTLGIDPLLEREFQDSICVGEVYTYNGIDYTLPGQYVVDTITAGIGCDTILILDLLVNPLDTTYIDTFICTGGVFTIGGIDYTMTGEYLIDTIPAAIGCDSVRILRLVVNDFNELTISAEICEGETYTINGMDFTSTGLYTIDTLAGPGGCDTVLFLDLIVNPLPTANAGGDLTIDCDVQTVTLNGTATGGSILWTGPDINAGNETQLTPAVSLPGTYILTVTSAEGCIAIDSVVVNLDPESVIANAGIDDSLSCDVLQITLQGSPLGPDYTYQWTGPGIDATNENLPNPTITEGGTYTLVVTNTVTQCVSAPDDVVISDISAILIAIIQDPVSFNCFIDSIDLATVGSSTGPNIVYAWFDAEGILIANTPGLEITSGGMFTLIVEDTVSGCFDDDTVMVKDLTQYPQVDAGLPQSIDCDTPTALLNEGATNNNNNIVFQWTSAEGGIVGPDTLITAVVNIPGQYYYLMATDTTNGCQNQDSVFVTDQTELPLADINIAEIITCIDESALLTIGNSSTGTGIMYVWSGPDLNNIVSETLETSVPGQYYLDVINEATGCSSRDTASLVAPMEPQDLTATIELPLCEGDPSGIITIDSVTGGTPVYMYSINGGTPQTSPTFEDLYAGVYSIAVVDANGCVYAESYTVAEGIQLTIDIGPDIDLVLGDSVILWADVSLPWSQIDSIVWTPLDILSCTYCINPVLYGLQSDVVTATVYSGGCIDQDMLNVRVDVDANIYIPNVFSPNDDGINDYVTIFTDHRVRRIVYFEIFDRWGNQVFVGENFQPNDPLLGWDGSFKGKVMNPAVFAYIARVELINGDHIDRKGDITIVR